MQQTCNRSQSPVTSSSIAWICCTLPSVDSGRLRNQGSRRRPEENSSQGLEDSPRWRLLVLMAHWRFCRLATRVISPLRELRLAAASMKHQGGATGSSRSCEEELAPARHIARSSEQSTKISVEPQGPGAAARGLLAAATKTRF